MSIPNLVINTVILIAIYFSIFSPVKTNAYNASDEWTESTWQKHDNLINIGFQPTFAISLIEMCKLHAKNPVNCIKIGASISGAESSMGNRCYRYNCVGMNDGTVAYKDTMD